jgi:large conductance mechanosensitive channel
MGRKVIKGFKEFIMRGNVIELAVAVVMGAAFGAIVNALVSDIVMPLITAIFGKQNYAYLYWTVNGSRIMYGAMLNAVIAFLCIAVGVYFCIVLPINHFNARRRRVLGLPEPTAAPTEVELLAEIRDALAASGPGSAAPRS